MLAIANMATERSFAVSDKFNVVVIWIGGNYHIERDH
jgi:hypothetical protein